MEGNSHMNTNGEEQEVKKKKKIIAVYNTHNSKTGIKDPRAEKKQQAARQHADGRGAGLDPCCQHHCSNTPFRNRKHDRTQGYKLDTNTLRISICLYIIPII